jgi:hypothetical protein
MKAILAAASIAALLALPAASAVISTADQYAAAEMIVDTLAPGTADLSALPVVYVDDQGDLWQESNGLAGLQTEATASEDGEDIPADTFLGGFSSIPL